MNVVIVFIFWMYILYISYVKTTRWKPPLLPHILMFGLLLASAAGKYIYAPGYFTLTESVLETKQKKN